MKEFAPEIKEIGDKIVRLTILQAKALGDYIREVHGINEASYGISLMNLAPGTGDISPEKEEKATLDVILSKVSDTTKKIGVIKMVREVTGLGLKESKDLVDRAPQTVKSGVQRDEAEAMRAKLEKEGATVELK